MAEWIDVATEQLSRLENPHREKKRATIIALVDARLAGETEESVWTQPQCCSRNTYHSKWKRDPVFADVLDKVYDLARDWNDGRSVRALDEAAERLALVIRVPPTQFMPTIACMTPMTASITKISALA